MSVTPFEYHIRFLAKSFGLPAFAPDDEAKFIKDVKDLDDLNRAFFEWYYKYQAGEPKASVVVDQAIAHHVIQDKLKTEKAAIDRLNAEAANLYHSYLSKTNEAAARFSKIAPRVRLSELDLKKLFADVEKHTCLKLHKPEPGTVKAGCAPSIIPGQSFESVSNHPAWVFETKEGTIVEDTKHNVSGSVGQILIFFDVHTLFPISCAEYRFNRGFNYMGDGFGLHPHFYLPYHGRKPGEGNRDAWVCLGDAAPKVTQAMQKENYLEVFKLVSAIFMRPSTADYHYEVTRRVIKEENTIRVGDWSDGKAKETNVECAPAQPAGTKQARVKKATKTTKPKKAKES